MSDSVLEAEYNISSMCFGADDAIALLCCTGAVELYANQKDRIGSWRCDFFFFLVHPGLSSIYLSSFSFNPNPSIPKAKSIHPVSEMLFLV
jgi:hypothetical protein